MAEDINIKARITADTGDATKNVTELKKGMGGLSNETKKAADGNFDKLKQSLTSVSPAMKGASEGAGMFNNALNLLKANPIIAVIAALAGVVISLFQKFKNMEGVADSLGKAWGTLSGIFEKFLNAILTPLIDGFSKLTELFTNGLVGILDTLGISSKETADRFGEITEALDDLQDAEKDAAIAMAESNRKLQEAREIAGDANVPIKERIAALKEAGRIEKEELDKVVKMNQLKAQLTMESIAMELGARQGLINMIKSGSLEQLKAARAELASLKNVDKEKLYSIDQMIIAAENAGAQSAKVGKKTQSAITSLEKEEEGKREAIRKEYAAKAKAAKEKANEERYQQEKSAQERLKKLLVDGEKAIQDALKVLRVENRSTELAETKEKFDSDIAAAEAAGFSTLKIREAYYQQRDAINLKYDVKDREQSAAQKTAQEESTLANQQRVLGKLTNFVQQSFDVKKAAADAEIELDRLKLEQQEKMVAEIGDILGKAGQVFGQQTAVGKAIAIAEATINAFKAGSQVFAAPVPGVAPVSLAVKIATMVAAIANGFKTVKSIIGVKVPSAGSAGAAGSVPAIPAPIAPTQQNTQLNAASIQGIGNAAAGGVNRAYVTESDITSNVERIRTINRRARLA